MATSTPNHGLYKYGGDDAPDLTALGPSMDKIDLELKKNADNIGLLNIAWSDSTTNDWKVTVRNRYSELPVGRPVLIYFTNSSEYGTMFACRLNTASCLFRVVGNATEGTYLRTGAGDWLSSIDFLQNASGEYAMTGVGVSSGRAYFVVNFPSPPPWNPVVTEFNVTNIGKQTNFSMSTSGHRLRIDTTNVAFVEGKAYHADAVLTF